MLYLDKIDLFTCVSLELMDYLLFFTRVADPDPGELVGYGFGFEIGFHFFLIFQGRVFFRGSVPGNIYPDPQLCFLSQ